MNHQHRLTAIALFAFAPALFLFVGLFTMLQTSQAAGTGVFCVVPPDASIGPFPACEQVFTRVQTAVNATSSGEEIWVASGVYTDVNFTGTMTQVVYIDKVVTLKGGFVPPFDALPNPLNNPTVLDAQRQGRVIVVMGTTTTIDGFHISGGNGDQDMRFSESGMGGGIYAENATLTVTNNTIYNNVGSRFYGAGGGIKLEDTQFTISNNDIYSNTAVTAPHPNFPTDYYIGFGGGVAIAGSQGVLHNNSIHNNIANTFEVGNGGGINLSGGNQVTITHNTITDNLGGRTHFGNGGGISWFHDEDSEGPQPYGIIANNLISGNVAQESGDVVSIGGGLALFIRVASDSSEPLISLISNDIISNTAFISPTSSVGGVGGGVVLGGEGYFSLSHNNILSNTTSAINAGDTWGYGGGLVVDTVTVTLDGDRIQFNQIGDRGNANGFGIENSVVTMTNVVVADNHKLTVDAGIHVNESQVTMLHPTISRNGLRGIWVTYFDDAPFDPDTSSQVIITNSILTGHNTGVVVSRTNTVTLDGVLWYDTGNSFSSEPGASVAISNQVVDNPRFDTDGYHLTDSSAAIGQGIPSGIFIDIDGDGRPSPSALGADEYMPFKLLLPLIFK